MSGLISHVFPVLGPALVLFIGYIDLGKWVAAIEGGAHFGFDFLLVLIFFNCTGILCQYLSNCIGLVTRKNLAQICSEEYCRLTCVLLGIVAELSMIASDLTKILGVAHGFNLLFELDLFSCIYFAAIVVVIVPLFFTLLGSYKLEVLYISISSFTVFFYVLGIFVSHPEGSSVIHGRYSGLNPETACSIMVLLGANIMPHNFYIHSSIVQQHRRQPNISTDAMIHDQVYAIISIFTGIFLVNYVMMSSAASVFNNYDLLMPTFRDAFMLMDQIFTSPAAPFPFFLIFLFSSLITSLTLNHGHQVVLHYFFLIDLPIWVHHIIAKALVIIPALYCIQSAGSEGDIYQLLFFCQVILAMLLPPSVIPLFRVSSSRLIMGAFKISPHLKIFALAAFIGMFASNFIFTIEMLFGRSGWIVELRGDMGSGVTLPYAFLLFLAFASLGFTLYLVVTPLRASSDGPCELQRDQIKQSEYREETDSNMILYDEDQNIVSERITKKSLESQSDCSFMDFDLDQPETSTDSEHGGHKYALGYTPTAAFLSQAIHHEEEAVLDEVFASRLVDTGILPNNGSRDYIEENMRRETKVGSCEPLESSTTTSSSEVPESSKNTRVKGKNVSNGNQKESISGFGRGGRRQLAAILDEFWGHLFDYHGQLTEEAKSIRADILLGLDFETTTTSMRAEPTGKESSQKSSQEAEKSPVFPTISREYNHAPSIPTAERCGLETPSYNREIGAETNSDSLSKSLNQLLSPNFANSSFTDYGDNLIYFQGQNGFGSLCTSGLQNQALYRSYDQPSSVGTNSPSDHTNKKHTFSSSNFPSNGSSNQQGDPYGNEDLQYLNFDFGDEEEPLALEDIPAPQHDKYAFFHTMSANMGLKTLWSQHQYEQHFTSATVTRNWGGKRVANKSGKISSYGESESVVLESLRFCIIKLLRLEGSSWLFSQSGGCNEELIDRLAATERLHQKEGPCKVNEAQRSENEDLTNIPPSMPCCGDGCIWQAGLVVTFGVWCVRRIFELLLVESRPELWGKYTYVLNRLQGILFPAFCKPRELLIPCECLKLPEALGDEFQHNNGRPGRARCTTASSILDLAKEIETAISGRKGRSGTAAGNVAFPKGKENLASVLKRYKRRLSGKSDSHNVSFR